VVEFYVDGKLLGSTSSAPYTMPWNLRKAGRGPHALRVRALDTSNNATERSFNVTIY
jgi:Bacterial Ig domain